LNKYTHYSILIKAFILFLFKLLPVLQAGSVVHAAVSDEFCSAQSLPPNTGDGLSHTFNLVLEAPA
jgi:hypothetical protein